jgi:hypothetical protein
LIAASYFTGLFLHAAKPVNSSGQLDQLPDQDLSRAGGFLTEDLLMTAPMHLDFDCEVIYEIV